MTRIKMVFIFLAMAGVCVAQNINLRGKILNSEGLAISGALVEIKNKGLSATSGADGSFLLSPVAIFDDSRNKGASPRSMTATMHQGILSIDMPYKSAVTVSVFSLAGTRLSKLRYQLNAGTHSIAFPQIGTGVYFYKVAWEDKQILLKGYSQGNKYRSKSLPVGDYSFFGALTKQAAKPQALYDVIKVTAKGYLNSQMTVTNPDTGGIVIRMVPENVCNELAPLPVKYEVINGPASSEDFEFDDKGNLISIKGGNLYYTASGAKAKLKVPQVTRGASGIALLPNGNLVIADAERSSLIQVAADGGKKTLAKNMRYPNGVTVDMHGLVYVSEQEGGRINQVNPITGDVKVVSKGLKQPNGVAFGPDYRYLYVVSFGSGTVHRVEFDENRNPVETKLYAENFPEVERPKLPGDPFNDPWGDWGVPWNPPGNDSGGTSWEDLREFDGVGVDACGNVYITEYITAIVWRVTTDKKIDKVLNLRDKTEWIPNIHWGSGIGGWDNKKAYVINRDKSQVFALEVGVFGKPMPQF